MSDQYQIKPMDLVAGIPNVWVRIPAILRAIKAMRDQNEYNSMG